MINLAAGPVQSCETVRKIGAEDVPNFRTAAFGLSASRSLIREAAAALAEYEEMMV